MNAFPDKIEEPKVVILTRQMADPHEVRQADPGIVAHKVNPPSSEDDVAKMRRVFSESLTQYLLDTMHDTFPNQQKNYS